MTDEQQLRQLYEDMYLAMIRKDEAGISYPRPEEERIATNFIQ